MKQFYVYILASHSRVLYVGMTNDLERRVTEHRLKLSPGFTSKYNVTRLVWYESFSDASQAIWTEKRIKGWTRAKKIASIEAMNLFWDDLFDAAPRVQSEPRHPEPYPAKDLAGHARQDASRSTAQHDDSHENVRAEASR